MLLDYVHSYIEIYVQTYINIYTYFLFVPIKNLVLNGWHLLEFCSKILLVDFQFWGIDKDVCTDC